MAVYSGGAVGLEAATPEAIVSALHDQFLIVSMLIAVAIAVSLWTWRWELRHDRAGKTETVPTAPPIEA